MRQKILGVNVDFGYTVDEVVSKIEELIKEKKGPHLIATTGPFFIMSAQNDPEFKEIVNNATLSTPDGVGVLYAHYYLDRISGLTKNIIFPLKAFSLGLKTGLAGFLDRESFGTQVTGVELTDRLCKLSHEKNYTIFFLGGRPRDVKGKQIENSNFDMATEAAKMIQKKYNNVRIIGASSAFKRTSDDDKNTIDYIHKCMTNAGISTIDVLLVAYNPVFQEKWIQRNAKDIPATICIGVGRTFDYISGYMRPTPHIYEKLHLAWLYALMLQIWRFKRVVQSFPIFPIKVFLESLKSS